MDSGWENGLAAGAGFGVAVGGALALLKLLGRAFTWTVEWIGGRQERDIAALRREVAELKEDFRQASAKVNMLGAVMAEALPHLPIGSEVRENARAALRKAFPVDPQTPADLMVLAARLDQSGEK